MYSECVGDLFRVQYIISRAAIFVALIISISFFFQLIKKKLYFLCFSIETQTASQAKLQRQHFKEKTQLQAFLR